MKVTNLDVELRSKLSHNPLGSIFLTGHDRMMEFIGGDVVIQGSYNTSNIGDLAIGQVIKGEMERRGFKAHLNGIIYSNQGPPPTFGKYGIHIIGGGGVIRDYPRGYLQYRLNPIETVKNSIVLGVGVNGIKTDKGKQIIRKLEKALLITVRDEKSKEILQPLIDKEVIVTACPAFLLKFRKEIQEVKYGEDKYRLGINLRPLPSLESINYIFPTKKINYKKYVDSLLYFIEKILKPTILLTKDDVDYFFIPFARQDITFARKHFKKLPIKILPLQLPSKTLSLISTMDRMICMRYHSLIFSIIAEVPVYVISYHSKVEELAKKIKNCPIFDISENTQKSHVELIENDTAPLHSTIKQVKKEMIKKASVNFSLLDALL